MFVKNVSIWEQMQINMYDDCKFQFENERTKEIMNALQIIFVHHISDLTNQHPKCVMAFPKEFSEGGQLGF